MSIHLSIKAENPEVESLLGFLQQQHPHADEGEKIVLLNDAIKWLRTVDEYKFLVNLNAGDEVSLDFAHTDPVSSRRPIVDPPKTWHEAVAAGLLTKEMAEALAAPDELMLRIAGIVRPCAEMQTAPIASAGKEPDAPLGTVNQSTLFSMLPHWLRAALLCVRAWWSGSMFRIMVDELRRFPLRMLAILADPDLRFGPAIPGDPRQHGQMNLLQESKFLFACSDDITALQRAHKWMGSLDAQIAAKAYQAGAARAFRMSDSCTEKRDGE